MKDWQWYALAALAVAAGWYVYRRRAGGEGGGGNPDMDASPDSLTIGDPDSDSLGDLDGGGEYSTEVEPIEA